MSANKEKDAMVDFLMTVAFVIVMLVVVKMSQNRHHAERIDGYDTVCESVGDHR